MIKLKILESQKRQGRFPSEYMQEILLNEQNERDRQIKNDKKIAKKEQKKIYEEEQSPDKKQQTIKIYGEEELRQRKKVSRDIPKIHMKLDEYVHDKHSDQQYKNEKWNIFLFKSIKNQYATIYMCGSQNTGKSFQIRHIVNTLGNKEPEQKTKIYWFSSIQIIDKKLKELQKDFDVILYNFDDQIEKKRNIFKEIFETLISDVQDQDMLKFTGELDKACTPIERKILEKSIQLGLKIPEKFQQKIEKKKGNRQQYIKNFIVFDDIKIPKKDQNTYFETLLRCYRHLQVSIISSTQDFVMQNIKQMRNLYQVKMFFGNIPQDRLKESIYPQVRADVVYNEFISLYRDATQERYGFILFDERSAQHNQIQDGYEYIYDYSYEYKNIDKK